MECSMDQDKGLKDKDAPSLESVHEVKLEALLHDLIRKHGTMEAAKRLGVNNKTVSRSFESGKLSVHLREALMNMLLAKADADVDQRKNFGTLEQAVEQLAAEIRDGLQNLRNEVEAGFSSVSKKHAQGFEMLSRELASMEKPPRVGTPFRLLGTDRTWPRRSHAVQPVRHTDPSVVTMEAQPDDEAVYGSSWPQVQEWRQLRLSQPFKGNGVPWLEEELRLRKLEIALIEEHGLTLPPDTFPWDGLGRKTQVRWRTQTLGRLRQELFAARTKRWMRRILTLGMWRN